MRVDNYTVRRRKRNWEVLDPDVQLVCVTLYKRGALEVVRRLQEATALAATCPCPMPGGPN